MTALDTQPDTQRDAPSLFGVELSMPTSAQAVIANARAIGPIVAEESAEVDRTGRLTQRLAAVMRAAGVFEMSFPAFRGGLEMTLRDQIEVTTEVASSDASAGWHVGVLNAGGCYAARLGDDAYAELYPTRDMPTCGSFHPRGRAERVPGGFLVSGRWDWGSGSYVAENIVGGVEVFDGDEPVLAESGKQMFLGVWLPKSEIHMLDNWQTMGLRGSGSASFEIVEPVFVPAHHCFDREARTDQGRDPLNRSVKIAHFALTGVVLGLSRHLANLAADAVRYRPAPVGEATLQRLGEALSEVDFSYAGVRQVADVTDDILFGGGTLTPLDEARMAAANAMAGLSLRRVLDLAIELTAARYIRDDSPVQPVMRDAISALAHAGTRKMHLGTLAGAAVEDGQRRLTVLDGHSGARGVA